MGLRESLSDGRYSSRAGRSLERAIQNSVVVDRWRRLTSSANSVDRWTRSSRTGTALRNAGEVVGAVLDRSGVGRLGSAIGAYTRSSFLYRWLTADPDPDVIVVDLRETIVLGSLLAMVDALVETFLASRFGSRLAAASEDTIETVADAPIRALSTVVGTAIVADLLVRTATGSIGTAGVHARLGVALLAILGLRIDASADELRESRGGRLLVALLEPPDPPEQHSRAPEDRDDGRRKAGSRDEET